MNTNETPRSDDAARKGAYMSDGDYNSTANKQLVHLNFARQLERELNEANARLEEARQSHRIQQDSFLSLSRVITNAPPGMAVAEQDPWRSALEKRVTDFSTTDKEGLATISRLRAVEKELRFQRTEALDECDRLRNALEKEAVTKASSLANERQLREALEASTWESNGSRQGPDGDDVKWRAFREKRTAALTLPAPPVVPMEDVKPLVELLKIYAQKHRITHQEAIRELVKKMEKIK